MKILFILIFPLVSFSQVKYDLYTSWEFFNGYTRSECYLGVAEYSAYGLDMKIYSSDMVKMTVYIKSGTSLVPVHYDDFPEKAVWHLTIPIAQTKSPLIIKFTDNRGDLYYWFVPHY